MHVRNSDVMENLRDWGSWFSFCFLLTLFSPSFNSWSATTRQWFIILHSIIQVSKSYVSCSVVEKQLGFVQFAIKRHHLINLYWMGKKEAWFFVIMHSCVMSVLFLPTLFEKRKWSWLQLKFIQTPTSTFDDFCSRTLLTPLTWPTLLDMIWV